MKSATFINNVQIILMLFNPYILLFAKLFALHLHVTVKATFQPESQLLYYISQL